MLVVWGTGGVSVLVVLRWAVGREVTQVLGGEWRETSESGVESTSNNTSQRQA